MIQVVHQGSGSGSWFLTYTVYRIQGSKRHRIPDPDPQHWHWRSFGDLSCNWHILLFCVAGSWWRRQSRWRRRASSRLRGTQRLPTSSPQPSPRRARAWSVYKTLYCSQGFGSVFIWYEYGSGFSILGWIPIRVTDPIRIQGFMTQNGKHLQPRKKINFFWIKNYNIHIPRPP